MKSAETILEKMALWTVTLNHRQSQGGLQPLKRINMFLKIGKLPILDFSV